MKLKAKPLRIAGQATKTVELRLPKVLRRVLRSQHRLRLRLTAKVRDPAGNTRTVRKTMAPRLRRH